MSNYLLQVDMPILKLWMLVNKTVSQYQFYNYNTLSHCIVCAETEEEAKKQHPANRDGSANITVNVFPEKQSSNRQMFLFDEQKQQFVFNGDKKREILNQQDSQFFEWAQRKDDLEVVYLGVAKPGMEKGVVFAQWNKY